MKTTVKRPARQRAVYLDDGRNPALNFINTRKRNRKGDYDDLLGSYLQFLEWCERCGVIDWDTCLVLEAEQHCYEREAENALEYALNLRLALRVLFDNLLDGAPPDEFFLQYFNRVMREVQSHLEYQQGGHGLSQFWVNVHEELQSPIWFIAEQAAQLMGSANLRRLKRCSACGSLFLDMSQSQTRTWCNPNTCGALRKSAQYYNRKNAKKAA